MNGPIPFTKEQLEAMRDSYIAGSTIYALSVEYGISSTAVRDRLIAEKVRIRPRGSRKGKRDPRAADAIRALRKAGLKVEEICHEFGICERTYYRRLRP
jgi:hypothetical protein